MLTTVLLREPNREQQLISIRFSYFCTLCTFGIFTV